MASTTKSATLDMSLFFGTTEQKNQFCTTLVETLKSRGVAKIKNHGISDETIHTLFEMVGTVLPETYFK